MTRTTDPLGPRIRVLRAVRGWSRRELALRARVNAMSIYRWEHGECRLQYRSRQMVAGAFGLTVQQLESEDCPMETPGLEPGWLNRQLAKNADEVDLWPGWMRKEAAARAQREGRPAPTYRHPPPEERIPQLLEQIRTLTTDRDALRNRVAEVTDRITAREAIISWQKTHHPALDWQDQPAGAGWYWFKIGTSGTRRGPTEVMQLHGALCAVTGDGESWKPCTSFRRRWAGPLPVPD